MRWSRGCTTSCCAWCSPCASATHNAASRRCAPMLPAACCRRCRMTSGSSTPSCCCSPSTTACASTRFPSTGSTIRSATSTSQPRRVPTYVACDACCGRSCAAMAKSSSDPSNVSRPSMTSAVRQSRSSSSAPCRRWCRSCCSCCCASQWARCGPTPSGSPRPPSSTTGPTGAGRSDAAAVSARDGTSPERQRCSP